MHALRVAVVLLLFAPIVARAADDPSPAPPIAASPAPGAAASLTPGMPPPASGTPEGSAVEPPDFARLRVRMEAQTGRISAQMRASQITLRHAVLAALTPGQRALVAAVIGDLAIAPDPDVAAGARRIDVALSAAQQRAVLELINAQARQREKLFATMVEQTQTITSRFIGGGQPAPASPTSSASSTISPGMPGMPRLSQTINAMPIQSGMAFALPGPSLAGTLAPNATAGAALIGLLISPSWMGVAPSPGIIQRVGPAPSGEAPPR